MDIKSLLPLLDGWEYRSQEFDSEEQQVDFTPVSPGERVRILGIKNPGWLLNLSLGYNGVFGLTTINLDRKAEIARSPWGLIQSNEMEPSPTSLWLSKYSKVVLAGRLLVTTAGTAQQLPNTPVADDAEVTLSSYPGNTSDVYIASQREATSEADNRFALSPGESAIVKSSNLDRIWVDAAVSGEGIRWMVEHYDYIPDNLSSVNEVNFTPAVPAFFKNELYVSIYNPKTTPKDSRSVNRDPTNTVRWVFVSNHNNFAKLYISRISVLAVEIVDQDSFKRSLRDILGNTQEPALLAREVSWQR